MTPSTGAAVLGAALFILLVLLGLVLVLRTRQALANRKARDGARAKAEAWRAEQMNRPAVSQEEDAAFRTWFLRQARPAVLLQLSDPVQPGPNGSHIGGQVWMPEGEEWPRSATGQPLQFLAQLDFATLPPLPDFPTQGVLQFFTGPDDLYGANFDDVFDGAFRVIWRPDDAGAGVLRSSPEAEEDYSPLSKQLRQFSRSLVSRPDNMLPSPYGAEVEGYQPVIVDRPGFDGIATWMTDHATADRETHHVGGFLGTTQGDFRKGERFAALDRVLLQLWSERDGSIMWGDLGQGSFTISQADLLARRFDRVAFHWDCT